jgi:hypothetical protein
VKKLAAITLALTLWASSAGAFSVGETSGHVIKWNKTSLDYYLDSQGVLGPSVSLGTTVFPAIRSSVATWNVVTCNASTITELGILTGAQSSLVSHKEDDRNLISWIPSSQWTYTNQTLAVTNILYYSDTGRLVDADIGLNGKIDWSLTSSNGIADVQSVVTHELGHYLGLQHVLGGQNLPDPPTMSPYMDTQLRTRTLTQDDIDGVCFLYPATPYTCSTIGNCPYILDKGSSGTESYVGRIDCVGTSCQGIVAYQGALGDLCDPTNGGCQTSLSCTTYSGVGYCTQPCSTSSCPSGYECTSVAGSAVCLATSVVNAATGGCSCDVSSNCDAGCHCDPDCSSGGCSASPEGPQTSGFALLIAAFVYIYARAKRRPVVVPASPRR